MVTTKGFHERSRFRHSCCEDSNPSSGLRGRRATITLYSGLNSHLSNSPSSPRHRRYYSPQGFHKVPNESRQSVFGQNGRCYRFSSISFFTFKLPPSRCLNGLGFYYNQWWEMVVTLYSSNFQLVFRQQFYRLPTGTSPKNQSSSLQLELRVGSAPT